MSDRYEPNANPAAQAGAGPYAQPMPGMGAGYDSLFQILWRGRWLILLSLVLAAGGACSYLWIATPLYESTARLLVDKPNPQTRSDVPQPVGSTLTNYLATQATLITSPEIIAAALRDPNVLALPTFGDPNYVKALIGTLSADVAKKGDIIQITASSAHPEDAAQLINAVVRAYIRWHEANRQLTTADLLKDLNSQLENRYRELQQKRREQMLFEQRHPEVVENMRGGIVSQTLDLLKQELASARLTVVERDSYYQGLQRFEKEPDAFRQYVYGHQAPVAAGDGERIRLQAELQKTRFDLEDLLVAVIVQRARVTMLQNRQSELEKKVADLDAAFIQQQIALAKTLSEEARAREKQLADMYDKEFAKVQGVSDQDSQYAFLKSECEMIEKLCNSLLTQINQLDLSARLEGLKIYVLAKALPAGTPSSPQPMRAVGIALVLGLMAGAGLSLIRDWRDQHIRSADEITTILGVPILGAIPSVPRRAIARGQRLRFAPNSRESEACRAIRTALLCGVHRDQMRTILVTSPGPQEGKTLLVSNLGIAMAQAGLKTLIVDADLRKPVRQRVFTTNGQSKGLVEVLAGTIGLPEAIRPTDIDRLDVLEGGQSTANPSELLNSQGFAALLAQLKGQYDRVLVDSPPVGLVTDAQILATLCDATLLVLRAEESSRILTQRARDALLAVGAPVVGVIVNDISKKDGRYGPQSGYGYYYSHHGSNGHKAEGKVRPMEAGPRPEGEALAVKKDQAVEQSDSQTVGPKTGALPVPISEYHSKAGGNEARMAGGPPPGSAAVTAERKKNGRKLTPDRRPTDAGAALDEAPTPPKSANEGQATDRDRQEDAGPTNPHMAAAMPEKRNGRKAASNGQPADAGPHLVTGPSTAEKGKNGRKGIVGPSDRKTVGLSDKDNGQTANGATDKGPPPDAGSHPANGDWAAERWRRWLQGDR